jgi:putative addiction module component (TIGR02574 family)
MSIASEKVAEVLALPLEDRAYLAKQLIASLDPEMDQNVEAEWQDVIERRSSEIKEGRIHCRPVSETIQELRAKLHAGRQPS